jgi:hypothetical protein
MKNLIPVEGKPNLYRDSNSGAIINTDRNAYNQHLNYIKNIENEKNRIHNLEKDVQMIKNDISDVKFLLKTLIEKS